MLRSVEWGFMFARYEIMEIEDSNSTVFSSSTFFSANNRGIIRLQCELQI